MIRFRLLRLSQWVGVPLRAHLRKIDSSCTVLHSTPVYFQGGDEEDRQLGHRLVVGAMDLVRSMEPTTMSQAPKYLDSIMVTTTTRTWVFFSADRCFCVNPWNIHRECDDLDAAERVLAAGISASIAFAKLCAGARGESGIVHRNEITRRRVIRFLEKCQDKDWNFDTGRMIEHWKAQ